MYTHTCIHTNIHRPIQRYTYILAYMYMLEFIHKTTSPIIPTTTDNGKMIFIHSGNFYSASLSPLLLKVVPDHSNRHCLRRSPCRPHRIDTAYGAPPDHLVVRAFLPSAIAGGPLRCDSLRQGE